MVVEIKCNGYQDAVKAIEQDYRDHVVFVDWTTNTVIIEGPGSGDYKQDSEVAYVKELLDEDAWLKMSNDKVKL